MASTDGSSVNTRSVKEERARRRRDARLEANDKTDRAIIEFQPDAVEIEHRKVPGGARWTLYTVILMLLAFVAWSWWAQVDQIVTAQGKLVTSEPSVVIQSFTAAPIRSLNVKFGDRVKAGQVLATLDPTFSDADLNQLELKMEGNRAAIARLTAEKDGVEFNPQGRAGEWLGQYAVFLERKQQYDAKMREFESSQNRVVVQQGNNVAEIKQNKTRVKMFKDLEDRYKSLARTGSGSGVDLMSRRLQTNDARMQLMTSSSKKKELVAQLVELQKQQTAFIAGWRAEVAMELLTNQQELAANEQNLSKAQMMSKLVELKVDPAETKHKEFVVLEVADRSVGSVLKEGEALCKLLPLDVALEAEVEIDGKDIAKIRTLTAAPEDDKFPSGTRVTVKLNAFPFQKHGTLTGFVKTVSEDVFEKETASGVSATYRGRIQLMDPIKLDKVSKDFRLMPGMTTIAEIKVGKRRVIHYFLYPIFRYMDEAFREPAG